MSASVHLNVHKDPRISGKRNKELLSAEFRKLNRIGGVYT